MSNAQACFQIEDRAPSGEIEASPPPSGVRESRSLTHVSGGRSAATMPGAGVDRFAETLPVVDETPAARGIACDVEWCVDLGDRLTTRTIFALWESIGCGEIRGNMLVWREGMECWTPVDQVSELACALEAAPKAAPEPSPESTEATTNPELPRRSSAPEPAAARTAPPRRIPSRDGKWIALGSAVATTALAAAALTLFLSPPTSTRPSAAPPVAAAPALPAAAAPSPLRVATPSPLSAATPAPLVAAPPSTPALPVDVKESAPLDPAAAATVSPRVRHDDRGQHRRRAGERR